MTMHEMVVVCKPHRQHAFLGIEPLSRLAENRTTMQELGSAGVPHRGTQMPKLVEGIADKLRVPSGKRDVLVFDGGHADAVPGFGIRKFASGRACYIVKYGVGDKQRRQSLGAVTRGNLKAMRLLASEVKARARLGLVRRLEGVGWEAMSAHVYAIRRRTR